MPKDNFNKIGEYAQVEIVEEATLCGSCDRKFVKTEKALYIQVDWYRVPICKDCIKKAAKRLGVMR